MLWPLGMPYIVFPGNVGADDTLTNVAVKLGVSRVSVLPQSASPPVSPSSSRVNINQIVWNKSIKEMNRTHRILESASQQGIAIAAFNVYNLEGAKAAVRAAEEQGTSVLLQVCLSFIHCTASYPHVSINLLRCYAGTDV